MWQELFHLPCRAPTHHNVEKNNVDLLERIHPEMVFRSTFLTLMQLYFIQATTLI